MTPSTPSVSTQAIAIVPARLASTRLPRKMLRPIAGKPLLAWVVNAAVTSGVFARVVVATDSEEIAALCRQQGWEFQMTAPELPSGTDRVNAVAQRLAQAGELTPDAIVANIQGDEPLVRREQFEALLRPFANPAVAVSTVATACAPQDAENPNVVKVVTAPGGRALYFSRAPIPWDRDGTGVERAKHLGLYAYRLPALARFAALPPAPLEQVERLEQLRLLVNGIDIYVEPVNFDSIGVDTEADAEAVAAILARR